MQWLNHCVLWQIFLVVVFVWAPAPFVCLVCCFSWRNASLAGGFAGRLAGLCVVVVVVICLHFQTVLSLYKVTFYRLCSCKDRATVRHRPHSRKKKLSAANLQLYRPLTGSSSVAVARTVTKGKVGDLKIRHSPSSSDMNTVPGWRGENPVATCRVSKTLLATCFWDLQLATVFPGILPFRYTCKSVAFW